MAALAGRLSRWRDDLAEWAIPRHIAASVTEPAWELPRQVFARRADRLSRAPAGPSFQRAWQALDPAGSVLDVGSGAGAASLPLAARTTTLTAVDTDDRMLALLAGRASAAGLAARMVPGRWPDVAGQVPVADLVTCHHVLYNVPGLGPFLAELTRHARRQVVTEITALHPLTPLNPLWLRFHGLKRPDQPSARDVLEVLAAMGLEPGHTEWSRPAGADYQSMAELVDVTRRRLCLPSARAGEVEAALVDLGWDPENPAGPGPVGRDMVTIWWEGSA